MRWSSGTFSRWRCRTVYRHAGRNIRPLNLLAHLVYPQRLHPASLDPFGPTDVAGKFAIGWRVKLGILARIGQGHAQRQGIILQVGLPPPPTNADIAIARERHAEHLPPGPRGSRFGAGLNIFAVYAKPGLVGAAGAAPH